MRRPILGEPGLLRGGPKSSPLPDGMDPERHVRAALPRGRRGLRPGAGHQDRDAERQRLAGSHRRGYRGARGPRHVLLWRPGDGDQQGQADCLRRSVHGEVQLGLLRAQGLRRKVAEGPGREIRGDVAQLLRGGAAARAVRDRRTQAGRHAQDRGGAVAENRDVRPQPGRFGGDDGGLRRPAGPGRAPLQVPAVGRCGLRDARLLHVHAHRNREVQS